MGSILYLLTLGYPNPHKGGGGKIIYELIKKIDRDKLKPAFLSYDLFLRTDESTRIEECSRNKMSIKKKTTYFLFENIPLYKKLTNSSLYLSYYYPRQKKYFDKMLKSNNWDIVHSHDNLSMAYLPDSLKTKKILTIHSKGPFAQEIDDNLYKTKYFSDNKSYFNDLENNSLEKADVITFPSEHAKDLFISKSTFKNFHGKDIRVVYNGIDIDLINSIPIDKEILKNIGLHEDFELIVLNVAEHVKPKNISLLIESMNIIVNQLKKNICLINVGGGIETSELENQISTYNLEKNVILACRLPNKKVIQLMKICDYFIMPSERVVFDMVILEALACGCCVVASEDGGNKEIIQDGINGYFLEELSKEAIVDSLLSFDKEKTKINAYKTIKQFSINRMVEEYSKLYDKIH